MPKDDTQTHKTVHSEVYNDRIVVRYYRDKEEDVLDFERRFRAACTLDELTDIFTELKNSDEERFSPLAILYLEDVASEVMSQIEEK